MGLFDGIEKLINEHGSAVILKQRIDLANDKYSALEDKNSILEQKIALLEAENKSLRANLEKAEAKSETLRKLTTNTNGGLDKVKVNIILLLAQQDSYQGNIVQKLSLNPQVAAFHLEELEKMEFIYRSISMTSQEFPWELLQEGRRYLIVNGLIT